MAGKKKPILSKAILSLLIGVPTLFSLVGKIVTLIGLEARLAGRSLISIIILSVMFAILLTSTWLCVLAMLFFYLTSLQWTAQLSLLILVLLNIILLIIITLVISKFKRKLLFPHTRRRLNHARQVYKDL